MTLNEGEHPSAQRAAYITTNLIKLAGLYLAVNDAADSQLEALNLGLYAFMMAGANGLETFIDRFLGNANGRTR